MKNWKTKGWKILLIGLALVLNTALAVPQELDKVAAVVNNGVVLESDVNAMLHSVKLNANQAGQQLPDDATLRHQILDQLIMDQVILQLGQRIGLQITDQQLDQTIAGIARQHHTTPQQLLATLAAQGISYKDYRAQVRKEMTISEVRNEEVRRRITILPQEVDSLTKQLESQNSADTELNLSHILIPLPESPSENQAQDAQNRAEDIVSQARSGADFARLAITWSASPEALHGGELGWERIEALPAIFTNLLATAKKGDIIGPIRSSVGFHILKVNDIRNQQQTVSITEYHARHILLKPSPVLSDDQAKQQLAQIAADIQSGKISFEDAAKKDSQDPGSAAQGGDLGWASPTVYDPAFRDALLKLQKGQISQPVRSSFGWHLIELLGTRNVDKTDAAQKDRAYRLLFNRKFAEEAASWMQEQRDSAYIKILSH